MKKPSITRNGDRVTISFETKGFCDVTVAIEDAQGKIIRHLASGVLGPNAPEPFKKSSKSQAIIWDGKDDFERYVDDKASVVVRVSLGLKPRYEKSLDWFPKRFIATRHIPELVAQPEGVYIYEGGGIEQVKLFGHDGKYIRTVYPFPADKIKDMTQIKQYTFADGYKAPVWTGFYASTLLRGGIGRKDASWGTSATAFAVRKGCIASISTYICRLKTNGTAGDWPVVGPRFRGPDGKTIGASYCGPTTDELTVPRSAAFSPDGKWLYLCADYTLRGSASIYHAVFPKKHVVYRMDFASDKSPEPWLGGKPGKDKGRFNCPMSVCVDNQGYLYVADHRNNRVQIFTSEGKWAGVIPVREPIYLQVHHKTRELYVASSSIKGRQGPSRVKLIHPELRVFDPFVKGKSAAKEPKQKYRLPIRYGPKATSNFCDPNLLRICVDSWTDPVTIWAQLSYGNNRHTQIDETCGIERFEINDGKLKRLESWNQQTKKAGLRFCRAYRQRLHVDSRNGMLYIQQGSRGSQLLRINPDSGKMTTVKLPMRAEDIAIGHNGHILLRSVDPMIGRYRIDSMREVPFDYGEELGKQISLLVTPGGRGAGNWLQGGFGVNHRGEIVVHACNSSADYEGAMSRTKDRNAVNTGQNKYVPKIYPGRRRYGEIHVFDKHGKPVGFDIAGKGSQRGRGVLIDNRGDIYFFSAQARAYKGKPFFPLSGCVMKFKRGKGRFLSSGGTIPLPKSAQPDVPKNLNGFWVQDAEWMYPGAGFSKDSPPCTCWQSRFCMDSFARSFIPEYIRNQIAVLDTNGNLILHVGRTGNVDDGVPLVEDMRYRSEKPRSIGGDNAALFYPSHLAVYSDHRLFIDDQGNSRFVSVKLGYHTNHKTTLKDIPDSSKKD